MVCSSPKMEKMCGPTDGVLTHTTIRFPPQRKTRMTSQREISNFSSNGKVARISMIPGRTFPISPNLKAFEKSKIMSRVIFMRLLVFGDILIPLKRKLSNTISMLNAIELNLKNGKLLNELLECATA